MAKPIMARSPADRCIAWTVVAFLAFAVGLDVPMFAARFIPSGHASVFLAVFLLGMICAAVGLVFLCFSAVLAWRAVTATPRHIVLEYLRALRIPISVIVAN